MTRKRLLGLTLLAALTFGSAADARPPGPPYGCQLQSLEEIIDALLTRGSIEAIVCYY